MSETKVKAEVEPIVVEDYVPGGQIATVGGSGGTLMSLAPEEVSRALEARVATQEQVMGHLVRSVIQPKCWIDMGGKAYLQGDGALAAFRFLGLRWIRDNDGCRFEADPETNQRLYFFRARLETASKEVLWEGFGARGYDDLCKRLPDVIHAAEKNAAHHAAVAVLPIGSMDSGVLRDRYGVTPVGVAYKAGSKGGKGPRDSATGELVCPFGRSKGTPLSQMSDADLSSMRGYLADRLEDAANAKFRPQNEALIDAASRILEERELDARSAREVEG